ncbi:MAG TPA: AAA family ATPase [Rubrobacteraceae bacterium]|nr:AAA family ATPase [Rubrobacteraceae bacterium]
MPDTRLFLLGSPRIEHAGAVIEVDTRKAVALLAYLSIEEGRHGRDALAGLLWPEYSQSKSRAALRRTLSALSGLRSAGPLEVDRESAALNRDGTWIDAVRFRELLERCRTHGHPETEVCAACLPILSEAAGLYHGDFLAGFGLRDSFDFDDWQYFQAESLRRELGGALERLARGYGARNEWEQAIAYARRRLALDPLSESAHRALMQAYALSGQRADALRQYRECVRTLEKELGVPPLAETTGLYRTIEQGGTPPPFSIHTVPEADTLQPESASEVRFSGSPMVGRAREWEDLRKAYGPEARGYVVVLEGEAGIGKTRLAEEFVAHVRESGAVALAARCYAGETNLAYGPFAEALESALGQTDVASRLEEIPDYLLSEARRLLPGLAGLFPDLPDAPPLDAPGAQSRFFEGVSRVLLAVCGGEPSGILFLDDLQWADDASLDLLSYLVRRLDAKPLRVLVAWREEEVPEGHRLRALVREAQRAGHARILELGRLEAPSVRELVRSVAGEDEELERRLYDETEGLPLFLTEYLAAAVRGELGPESGAWSLPGGVRDLLEGRLQSLNETGKQLLAAAAAIGRSFDFDTAREASGRSEEETIAAIEELGSRFLIREVPESAKEGYPVYDFSHEKLREIVYEKTSLARKRLLHQRIATALADRADRRREGGSLAGQISYHYRMAGQDAEAAEYAKLAGEHARALYANGEALSHYQTALALGYPDAAALHAAIGDLRTLTGEYEQALASYETAAALSAGEDLAGIERKLGDVHGRRGEWELAESHYAAALEALGEDGSPERARLYADRSLLAHRQGQDEAASEFARRALDLAEEADDERALVQAHNALGILASSRGDFGEARRRLERSLALAESLNDPEARIAALNNLALALGRGEEVEEAMDLAGTALALCVSLGDRHREAALRNNLADLLHTAGRQEESMSHLKEAVAIFAEIGEEGALRPEIWKLVEW